MIETPSAAINAGRLFARLTVSPLHNSQEEPLQVAFPSTVS